VNISSRLRVQPGDNALFAGFIITGSNSKRVLLRAIAPSLKANQQDVPGRLDDPTLELFDGDGKSVTFNDDWKDAPDRAEIEASGFAPSDDRESVITLTLNPGAYSAILRGKDNKVGIAVVEVYDRTSGGTTRLANISSRGLCETGDNVLIGGFIVGAQTGDTRVLVRAIGPSLKPGIANALSDPTIALHNENGDILKSNDDWKQSADRTEIEDTGIAPKADAESAVIATIPPGHYTAIVEGKNNSSGVALVEVYNVKPR
jgi:hypothetical protein